MGASTALADRSGGQFGPECLVSLPRNGVVNLTRNHWSHSAGIGWSISAVYPVQDLNAPLIKTNYVLGNKTRLISVLLKGLKGVEINGEKYSNVMPSHSFLTDKQIANVLTYVRNSFGNKASAVTYAEVALIRKTK
ncbi:c-type cytochrome [Mucilaginibacter antarcticus]